MLIRDVIIQRLEDLNEFILEDEGTEILLEKLKRFQRTRNLMF